MANDVTLRGQVKLGGGDLTFLSFRKFIFSMSDCTWRGKVYCDGDVVIVRIFWLTRNILSKIFSIGFVPMVVHDGLQGWQHPDGAQAMAECCQ